MAKISRELVAPTSEEKLVADIKKMMSKDRVLTIKLLDKNQPDFSFEGTWTGRDIMIVQRTIIRAYRRLQMAARQRVQAAVSEQKVNLTAKG